MRRDFRPPPEAAVGKGDDVDRRAGKVLEQRYLVAALAPADQEVVAATGEEEVGRQQGVDEQGVGLVWRGVGVVDNVLPGPCATV